MLQEIKDFYNSRFVKFAIIGTSGVFVNTAILMFCHERLGLELVISSIAAIETAIFFNFFFNDTWTFYDKHPGTYWSRFCKFNLICFAGALVNVVVLTALTYAGLWYVAANWIGIGAGFLWNYHVNSKKTWEEN